MCRPEIPFLQEGFGCLERLIKQFLKVQADVVGTACFLIEFFDSKFLNATNFLIIIYKVAYNPISDLAAQSRSKAGKRPIPTTPIMERVNAAVKPGE